MYQLNMCLHFTNIFIIVLKVLIEPILDTIKMKVSVIHLNLRKQQTKKVNFKV